MPRITANKPRRAGQTTPSAPAAPTKKATKPAAPKLERPNGFSPEDAFALPHRPQASALGLASVTPSPQRVIPGWMGNTAVCIHRDPNGRPTAGDRFTFDTWARQRASTAQFQFDVWAEGTTDRDNPDLWRELDVQVHYRYGDQGEYKTDYINFDRRNGNDARYSLELRKFDPWSRDTNSGHPSSDIPISEVKNEQGRVVGHQAQMQFFITVNGKELRPSDGRDFEGTYVNY